MKKKSVVIFLIVTLLVAAIFISASCDDNNGFGEVTLTFDQETNRISWYADWATAYVFRIYDSDGKLLQEMPLSKNSTSMDCSFAAGDYTLEIIAYDDNEHSQSKTLQITIIHQTNSDSSDNSQDDNPVSDKDEPVKLLIKTYYYLKSDDGDLTIGLVNTSGIASVEAFGMETDAMWQYDERKNALHLKPSYLHRFSSGAVLYVDIIYNDGNEDCFDVQIVDELPLQIIGGEDGLIEVNTSSAILNYKIALGYDGETLKKGSSSILKAVCIDGKKRAAGDYFTNSSLATVSLYYTKVLSSLTSGLHYLEIYTTYGKSEVWLEVTTGREKFPCNVKVDFDSAYPNIFVTWDIYSDDADYFIVDVNGVEYSSKEYPQLFDGNSFDATDKIKYNETVTVKAVYGGSKKFNDLSKATLNVNIFNSLIAKYLSYDNSFEFLGTRYNYYISDFDEFFDMVYYSLLYYDGLEASTQSGYDKKITFYPNTGVIYNVGTSFDQVINMLNEAVKCNKYAAQLENSGVYELHLKVYSTFVPNTSPDVTQMPIEQNKFLDTHYSSTGRADDYEDFAVNSFEKQATVNLSEELYLAVERGIRPVPVADSSAYGIFEAAKSVLRKIIDDTMTDYQKVHAIYDWLGDNVIYDWEISNKMSGISSNSAEYNKFYAYRQFYLEGVFEDGLAVCNGIAKAMSLLCGIEGITCYKIKGTSRGGAHAWNKVCVDGNWYVIDATWANRTYTNSTTNTQKEVLAHYTVFMSEATSGNKLGGQHYEIFTGNYTNCYAGNDYNVFANTFFTYDSNLYDYVIDDAQELRILIDYYKDKCESNGFITIDVGCSLTLLRSYLTSIQLSGVTVDAYDYNGALSGVSTVVITKK